MQTEVSAVVSVYRLNMVLLELWSSSHLEEAQSIVREIQQCGPEADVETYAVIVNQPSLDPAATLRAIQEMHRVGIPGALPSDLCSDSRRPVPISARCYTNCIRSHDL